MRKNYFDTWRKPLKQQMPKPTTSGGMKPLHKGSRAGLTRPPSHGTLSHPPSPAVTSTPISTTALPTSSKPATCAKVKSNPRR